MLHELRVRELGVIGELELVLGPGLTAITGETGAGKTLVVEALSLLTGGRADASMVRAGATEASVEARFVDADGVEVIVTRAVAREGRSRAYLDEKMASVPAIEERGAALVELYAQHAHQALFQKTHQREALDRFAGTDLSAVRALRQELATIDAELEGLGGDDRHRARELDLVRFELAEIDAAGIAGAGEEDELAREEDVLANAAELRLASERAHELLEQEDDGAIARLGAVLASLSAHDPLREFAGRARSLQAEAGDLATELRRSLEALEEDPGRLASVRERRQLLRGLMRKYGESLEEVLATRGELAMQIAALEATAGRRDECEQRRAALVAELDHAAASVGARRRDAAPELALAVAAHLEALGLVRARVEVEIGPDPIGDDVELLFSANPGEPPLPLARVASGGELARAMLALRLVLTNAPPTLVFDEVDAGIGGAAALAVGAALAELAVDHQVIVVTHLAQVAAFAQHQFVVDKDERDGRTVAHCRSVDGQDRVVELSRMLSGHPDSGAARAHAAELLGLAAHAVAG